MSYVSNLYVEEHCDSVVSWMFFKNDQIRWKGAGGEYILVAILVVLCSCCSYCRNIVVFIFSGQKNP